VQVVPPRECGSEEEGRGGRHVANGRVDSSMARPMVLIGERRDMRHAATYGTGQVTVRTAVWGAQPVYHSVRAGHPDIRRAGHLWGAGKGGRTAAGINADLDLLVHERAKDDSGPDKAIEPKSEWVSMRWRVGVMGTGGLL
jgi:hypothetical protein